MSRLSQRFEELKARNEKALICYITAGDPSLELTVEIVAALEAAGVDLIEIGLPFSDPLADGPSIQASSQRSLDRGTTVRKTLEAVRQVRSRCPNLPLILMTYYNPIRCYGLEAYAADVRAAGADAHIVTDLTPEEAGDWKRISDANYLDTIFLVAPTSTKERIDLVTKISTGFVYCVSRTGVTGAREDLPVELSEIIDSIRVDTVVPICIGFGISHPEQVRKMGALADGVIVGSALVNLIHANCDSPDLLAKVREFAGALKAATLPE